MLSKLKRTLATVLASTTVLSGFACAQEFMNNSFIGGDPFLTSDGNWEGNVDLLIWRAREDGLAVGQDLAVTQTTSTVGSAAATNVTFSNIVKNHHFRWDAGVRLGLAYKDPCSCVDVYAYWTHFGTKSNKHLHLNGFWNDTLSGITFTTFPGGSVRSNWRLYVDLVDLEFGYKLNFNSCFDFRPFFGLRGGQLKQKLHSDYTNSAITPVTGVSSDFARNHMKSTFNGAGIRAGFSADWDLGCGFSLYGTAAGSILYGRFKVHSTTTISRLGTTAGAPSSLFVFTGRQRDHVHACQAVTDSSLGIQWKQFFCCDTMSFTGRFGWENQYFFNQNRFEPVAVSWTPSSFGDLCLHGFVLSARVDF